GRSRAAAISNIAATPAQAKTPTTRSAARAFSSEVDTGSREENASKQKDRTPFRFNRSGVLARDCARGDVDHQRQQRGVEHERDDAVHGRGAADDLVGDPDVGDL